jgi:hypothetical protein
MLIARLDRLATARKVITAFTVALSLILAANVFSSHFYDATGGYGLLDLAGGRDALTFQKPYTPADAYALMVHWGAGGRQDQLLFTLTLDVLVPPATWMFLTLALLYVTRPFAKARWRLALAVLLPAAYLLSDYGENVAILALVSSFPSRLDGVAVVGSVLWMTKTLTSDIAVCAILLALIIGLMIRSRSTAAPPRRQRRRSDPPRSTAPRPYPESRGEFEGGRWATE